MQVIKLSGFSGSIYSTITVDIEALCDFMEMDKSLWIEIYTMLSDDFWDNRRFLYQEDLILNEKQHHAKNGIKVWFEEGIFINM